MIWYVESLSLYELLVLQHQHGTWYTAHSLLTSRNHGNTHITHYALNAQSVSHKPICVHFYLHHMHHHHI